MTQIPLDPTVVHDWTDVPFPARHSPVLCSAEIGGAYYLREPGVVLVAKPQFAHPGAHRGLDGFLEGFPEDLGFLNFREDTWGQNAATELCKFAGQVCYLSLGPGRTKNAQAPEYFRNILSSGHGSILEHAQFTFFFYGISRSLTHELVRHRAGFAFSQVSQRYVDGSRLRFVERPEFQEDEELHDAFLARIEETAAQYEAMAKQLAKMDSTRQELLRQGKISKTDLRKSVNQVARCLLPNETEAPIVVSANVRAWRHFLAMRGSIHAETEIRRLAIVVAQILKARGVGGTLFDDVEEVEEAGQQCLRVLYPKV